MKYLPDIQIVFSLHRATLPLFFRDFAVDIRGLYQGFPSGGARGGAPPPPQLSRSGLAPPLRFWPVAALAPEKNVLGLFFLFSLRK